MSKSGFTRSVVGLAFAAFAGSARRRLLKERIPTLGTVSSSLKQTPSVTEEEIATVQADGSRITVLTKIRKESMFGGTGVRRTDGGSRSPAPGACRQAILGRCRPPTPSCM